MKTTTLSSQNQITLPKFITNSLGINTGDKILIKTEEDKISLKPMGKSLVENLAGSIEVPENKKGLPLDEIMSVTKEKTAQKIAQK